MNQGDSDVTSSGPCIWNPRRVLYMKHPQKVQIHHSSQGPVWQAAVYWALQYGRNTVYLSLRQTLRRSAKVRETPSGQKVSIGLVQNASD